MSVFSGMWQLINNAPYYIFTAFVGSFLLTFITVKVSQSDTVYQWFTGKIEVWRAKQARKVRVEMMADITSFLRGRQEQELSQREQKIYYGILESYYDKIERLYPGPRRGRKKQ
jgi:hypothetical protein